MQRILFHFFMLLCVSLGADTLPYMEKKPLKIAIISDGPSERFDKIRHLIEGEITALMSKDAEIIFSPPDQFKAKWTKASVNEEIQKALNDDAYQMILGIGIMASDAIAHQNNLPKPAIAAYVVNEEMQHISPQAIAGEVPNLHYLTYPSNFARDLETFHEISPFKHLTVIGDQAIAQSIPALKDNLKVLGHEMGIALDIIFVTDQAQQALDKLPRETDAVYITPLSQMDEEELELLLHSLTKRNIPTFSLFGQGYVNAGALASLSPDTDVLRHARRIALNIQRIFLGESPESLPRLLPEGKQLAINVETLQELDVEIPWDLYINALEVGSEKISEERILTLPNAVEEGLNQNRFLWASKYEVAAGCQDIAKAQAQLRPHVDLSLFAREIDKKRAEISLGEESQRQIRGKAQASQILYSNELQGNVKVQRHLQSARCQTYSADRLDTITKIAITYINLLRVQTVERIQYNNFLLTRHNLKLATQRERVGSARVSEVYRWESQLAANQSKVIDARFMIRSVKAELNQLLYRPQYCPIYPQKLTLDEPYWIFEPDWYDTHIINDRTLYLFIDWAVQEGMKYSPEIKRLYALICAKAKQLGISKRAFWSPTLSLVAEVSDKFYRAGAGSQIQPNDDVDWGVGVLVTFPLYKGGEKCATYRQNLLELKQLHSQLENTVENVKKVIYQNVYSATASYEGIHLARQSAETAKKNLDMVSMAYSKGTVSIVDLLDAQNQALVSDLVTANAIYDFLVDLVNLQRAMGRFEFEDEMTHQWRSELKNHFESYYPQAFNKKGQAKDDEET